MPSEKDMRLAAMVDAVRQKRLELAGLDNYTEGFWHGIAVGMLAMTRLEETGKRKQARKATK